MLLKHCTETGMARIASISVPPIRLPEHIDILWIRTHFFEQSTKKISLQSHKHSFFEVHFVFRGSAVYEVAGKKYPLYEGDALLIPPELTHAQKSFSDDLVKVNLSFVGPDSSFKAFLHGGEYRFSISECMVTDFERIFVEVEQREMHHSFAISNCVFSILCAILRSAGLTEDTKASEKEHFLCEIAMRYIEDNKNLFLNCAVVAAYCGCNEKYLSRRFKQEHGVPLLEYIHSVKITEAKRLLLETDTLLSEIAEMLGFSNEYYFNNFFKLHCGRSPGAFRERKE